jgi:hypothetical protein
VFAEDVGPQIVSGNAGDLFHAKDTFNRHPLPLAERLGSDPEQFG